MSELTLCNYCHMKNIVDYASKKKFIITIIPDNRQIIWNEALDVYMHPKNEDYKGWHVAWFAKLPEKCCC